MHRADAVQARSSELLSFYCLKNEEQCRSGKLNCRRRAGCEMIRYANRLKTDFPALSGTVRHESEALKSNELLIRELEELNEKILSPRNTDPASHLTAG